MKLQICSIVLLIAFVNYGVNADCCNSSKEIRFPCPERQSLECGTTICKDGTKKSDFFCGYDQCNIFGCNCRCRNNDQDSWNVARELYVASLYK